MYRKSSKGNFDKEFIIVIVEMYEDGHKISELCSDYEIKDVTIRSYKKIFQFILQLTMIQLKTSL